MNIATVFDKTYVTESPDGLSWFTFMGASSLSTPFNRKCLDSSWSAELFISPKKNFAFMTAFCSNISYFFLVDAEGTIVQQVGDPAYDGIQISPASWSPDSKYVAKAIATSINYRSKEDIYLFDIEKTLADPSTQPIQLTVDGSTKSWGPIWQPTP